MQIQVDTQGGSSGGISMLGDGLVPLVSALGQHKDARRNLALPKAREWIGYGMNHMDLLDRKDVYAQLQRWLAD